MINLIIRNILSVMLVLFFPSQVLSGQHPADINADQLKHLFDRLLVVNQDSVRLRINDSVEVIVDDYVCYDSVFYHRFDKVRFLGQVTSPDSLLKIITWNLNLRSEQGRYYCYIIHKDTCENRNSVFKMTAKYSDRFIKSDTIYNLNNWYGALYYDIRPQILNGFQSWMLLGIDYGNPEISRKLIEVLSFSREDQPVFGMKVFDIQDSLKYRAVFEYSSTATMSLRFGGDDSVLFDHLVPFSPELAEKRQFYGPDFSIDAFIPENGIWKLNINVDARNKD